MSKSIVAKRYGVALFQLAEEHGQIDAIQQELVEIKEVFQKNPELQYLLDNPKMEQTEKKELLEKLFGKANQLVRNTLFIMLEKNRLGEIVNTVDEYTEYAYEAAGIANAVVYSTTALTDDERQGISTAFAAKIGRTSLQIENIIDPSLIGGIRVQIGNHIYDNSVRSKLERMQKELIGL